MGQREPCRVQWVAQRVELDPILQAMKRGGARLIARSAFEPEVRELDELGDATLGDSSLKLGIMELAIDPGRLARQISETLADQAEAATVIVDFTGRRIRVQMLPVKAEAAVILHAPDGVERFAHGCSAARARIRRRLVDRLARRAAA